MAMRVLPPLLLCFSSPAFCGAPKCFLLDGELAVPFSADNSCFRAAGHPAYDYCALSSFYVPQRTCYSCSSAASAAAPNAQLNTRRERGDSNGNVTEEILVSKVSAPDWKALTSEKGLGGRHGLTLDQLASALRRAPGQPAERRRPR